jgi:hypothetical protein
MKRRAPTITDSELDERLAAARNRVWPGPDHSPRVETHLKGIAMKHPARPSLSRPAILLFTMGALAGGGVAAAVTHTVMSRRAVLVTDDGTRYEVQLNESPDGASGTFVTDDGSVFGVEMVEQGGMQQVTVDVTAPAGGTSTVILDDGSAPSVTTLPGQTARIEIQKPTTPPTDE